MTIGMIETIIRRILKLLFGRPDAMSNFLESIVVCDCCHRLLNKPHILKCCENRKAKWEAISTMQTSRIYLLLGKVGVIYDILLMFLVIAVCT